MSPAFLFRPARALALFAAILAGGCAPAPRTEVLGRAQNGTLYLDGNELIGPFVFKTDGYWMLLDTQQRTGHSIKNLVLGDSVGYVAPDSDWARARPNDVAAIMDRASSRADLAGMSDADRLELTIRIARDYTNAAVERADVIRGQGVVHFRGQHDPYVFEIGSRARDSAQAAAWGLPRLLRADMLQANADGFIKELEGGSTLFTGIGYFMPSMGRSGSSIAAIADSLRQGYEQAWPVEYDWARDDVRSPRPLEKRRWRKDFPRPGWR
jgi:hypothetical protein